MQFPCPSRSRSFARLAAAACSCEPSGRGDGGGGNARPIDTRTHERTQRVIRKPINAHADRRGRDGDGKARSSSGDGGGRCPRAQQQGRRERELKRAKQQQKHKSTNEVDVRAARKAAARRRSRILEGERGGSGFTRDVWGFRLLALANSRCLSNPKSNCSGFGRREYYLKIPRQFDSDCHRLTTPSPTTTDFQLRWLIWKSKRPSSIHYTVIHSIPINLITSPLYVSSSTNQSKIDLGATTSFQNVVAE